MAATHLDNISLTITLGAVAVAAAGFGTVALLVDEADGNDLGGDRFRTYTNATDAATDQAASEISAATLLAVQVAFAQRTPGSPSRFIVARVDTAGAETYATAYAALEAAGADFYGVCSDSRTASEIVALAIAVNADRRLSVHQVSDADWKTTGTPAAYSTIDGNERNIVIYHDTDAQWADVAWACACLAVDPDLKSTPWHYAALQSVAVDATAPTQVEKDFLRANNANFGATMAAATYAVDPGKSLAGRPIYEQLTADWLYARLEAGWAQLMVDHTARATKLTVDQIGQAKVADIIEKWASTGRTAGHFDRNPANTRITLPTITAANITAQQVPVTADIMLATGARKISATIYAGTTALAEV